MKITVRLITECITDVLSNNDYTFSVCFFQNQFLLNKFVANKRVGRRTPQKNSESLVIYFNLGYSFRVVIWGGHKLTNII